MEMGIRFKLVNGTVKKWELTALEWKCKNPFPVIFSLDEVSVWTEIANSTHRFAVLPSTQLRPDRRTSPGAQFTKYPTIYRKIVVSLS